MRVSAKREGCSEAKPLGDAGREREARAEGRLRPVGAGGGVAPKRRSGLWWALRFPQRAALQLSVKDKGKN